MSNAFMSSSSTVGRADFYKFAAFLFGSLVSIFWQHFPFFCGQLCVNPFVSDFDLCMFSTVSIFS